MERELIEKRQWHPLSQTPCKGLETARFYEASSADYSFEFYLSAANEALAGIESFPEANFLCTPITEPTFIEEIY